MSSLRRSVFRSWPLVAALCALAVLGVAHGFETFGGLAPCHLCLQQREIYWVAVAVGLAGWNVLVALVLAALSAVVVLGREITRGLEP